MRREFNLMLRTMDNRLNLIYNMLESIQHKEDVKRVKNNKRHD